MKTRTQRFLRVAAGATALAAVVLCSSGPVMAQAASGMQHGDMKGSGDASMKMHMMMEDGQKKMQQMEMSGDPDRDFAMMMRAHHQMGIDMAKAELASGKDPTMTAAAKKIVAEQQKDIEKLDAWLKKHPAK
jgi:uncharacterized protein (DUF305 family)